jgi:hypothetical protein
MAGYTERTDGVPVIALFSGNDESLARSVGFPPILEGEFQGSIGGLAAGVDEDSLGQAARVASKDVGCELFGRFAGETSARVDIWYGRQLLCYLLSDVRSRVAETRDGGTGRGVENLLSRPQNQSDAIDTHNVEWLIRESAMKNAGFGYKRMSHGAIGRWSVGVLARMRSLILVLGSFLHIQFRSNACLLIKSDNCPRNTMSQKTS